MDYWAKMADVAEWFEIEIFYGHAWNEYGLRLEGLGETFDVMCEIFLCNCRDERSDNNFWFMSCYYELKIVEGNRLAEVNGLARMFPGQEVIE